MGGDVPDLSPEPTTPLRSPPTGLSFGLIMPSEKIFPKPIPLLNDDVVGDKKLKTY